MNLHHSALALVVGVISLTATMLCACQGGGENDEPLSDGRLYTSDNTETIVLPDTMRVTSWDELDNLTADALLGPGSGKVVKSHTYECVDTIAYSTLIFHINALVGLPDTSESDTQVFKVAKWTVELVSVEYYPRILFIPGYANIEISHQCGVDRYRNYSDGSRIGPDTYDDYGHFFRYYLSIRAMLGTDSYPGNGYETEEDTLEPIFTEADVEGVGGYIDFYRLKNGGIKSYSVLKEDGVYFYEGGRYQLNRNAYYIHDDGRKMDNEERFAIDFANDTSSYIRKVYDDYIPSNSYPEWAVTDDVAPLGYDLGKDVPVLYRTDTVRTVHPVEIDFPPYHAIYVPVDASEANVRPVAPAELPKPWYGWFFNQFTWERYVYLNAYSSPVVSRCIQVFDWNNFNTDFLHIDGRVIDFFNIVNWHLAPLTATTTRTATGYHYHLEDSRIMFGFPLHRKTDYYVDFYDGPEELIADVTGLFYRDELSQETELWNRLQEEKTSRSRAVSRSASPAPSVKLDTRLPHSFNRNK